MQTLVPTLMAVLVYLASLFGLTPGGAAARPSGEVYVAPSTGQTAAPAPTVSYPGATEVMAYYAERKTNDPAPYQSLARASGALTTVIPFSYQVGYTGAVTGKVNSRMLTLARSRGLKVLALLHNAGSGRFDSGAVHAFLASAIARQRAVDQIYALLVQTGLDGVNLDLENVPPSDRWRLTTFVQAVAARLRPRHFLVTASLPAKTYDDRTSRWTGAYDYAALNPYLDQVVLMTYDEHIAGGASGPVASYAWVDKVARYAATAFPRQKIVLGLPAYGYDWSSRGDRAVTFDQAASLLQRYSVNPSWDYVAQAPHFRYMSNGVTHQVWYENNRSAAQKAALVRKYGLRGVAVWRLGYEDPALWTALAGKLT